MKPQTPAELEALRIFTQYYNVLEEPVVYFLNAQMRYDISMVCAMMAVADILKATEGERTEFYREVESELKRM